MAAFTTLGLTLPQVIGLGTTAVGVGVQAAGQREASRASERNEALRRRQMELEANRQRRQAVRETVVTQAIQRSNAQASGATFTSGLQGGLATGVASGARNVQGVNQGQQIGSDIFANNAQIASGQSRAAFGGAIQGFGQQIMQNSEIIGRLTDRGFSTGGRSNSFRTGPSIYNPAYGQISRR